MADVYSAVYGDLDYWDGTIEWGFDATSNRHSPTPHVDQAARDAQYVDNFTSLNAWEIARDGAAGAGDTEHAIIQTPWDSDDTSLINVSGWTTGSIIVRAIGDARNQTGIWDDGVASPYRLVAASGGPVITTTENNVTYDGLQVHNTSVSGIGICIQYGNQDGGVISNCILSVAETAGTGIQFTNGDVDVWNNVIFCPHARTGAFSSEGMILTVGIGRVFNNTVDNFNDGIEIESAGTSSTIKNNVSFNNADDFDDAASSTIDYNASDDADGTNAQDLNENVGGEWDASFTDYANNDYSVKDASSLLYNNGTNDPGSGLFSDDLIGTSRPQATTWDIGAFELIVAVAGGANVPIGLMHRKIMKNLLTR